MGDQSPLSTGRRMQDFISPREGTRYLSKSAERAMTLLKVLARSENGMGLMEIAGSASLDKSTVARLLESLQKQGFVHRDSRSKLYYVGAGLLSLAASVTKRNHVLRLVHPFLERVRDLSGETSSFYLRLGDGRVCVDIVDGLHGDTWLRPVGEARRLVDGGVTSRVFLAHQPQAEKLRLLKQAKIEGDALEHQLDLLRQTHLQGFSAAIGEWTPNVAAISVPIHTPQGVVAAITVSGHESRWTMEAMVEFAPVLKQVAADLSALMHGSDMSVYGVGS